MAASERNEGDFELSLAHGGPFFAAQEKLGAVKRTSLNAGARALAAALVCWLPLAALSALERTLFVPDGPRALAHDYAVHVRFLIAVPLFFLMEPAAATRLSLLLGHFVESGLIAKARVGALTRHVGAAIAGRNAWQAEAILALAACALSVLAVHHAVRHRETSWIGVVTDGSVHLSPAGWWLMVVATPLFFFMIGRWLWRYLLWAGLLRKIAGLDLRPAVTHPDKTGGLAFIAQYPSVFTSFVLAVTAVAAAQAAEAMVFGGATIGGMKFAMIAWIVVVVAIFVIPLLAFSAPLSAFKRAATARYAALASRADRALEAGWAGEAERPDEATAAGVAGDATPKDLAAAYAAARSLRTVPLSKEAIAPVILAAVLPMLAAAATQAPIADILKKLLKMVVL